MPPEEAACLSLDSGKNSPYFLGRGKVPLRQENLLALIADAEGVASAGGYFSLSG